MPIRALLHRHSRLQQEGIRANGKIKYEPAIVQFEATSSVPAPLSRAQDMMRIAQMQLSKKGKGCCLEGHRQQSSSGLNRRLYSLRLKIGRKRLVGLLSLKNEENPILLHMARIRMITVFPAQRTTKTE